jgi:hypothetical protein
MILDFLKLIPVPIQICIASLVIGGVAFAGLESRYMTVADYTKSYVLDLKALIRDLKNDLRDEDLTPREREWIEADLQSLLDELCYERPDDRLCEDE